MYCEQEAERFIGHFNEEVMKVLKVESRLFKKILLFTVLDSLGRACYGSDINHHEKMIKTISDLANWRDKDRVSSPQLKVALENMDPAGSVRGKLARKIETWGEGSVVPISGEYKLEELTDGVNSDTQALIMKYTHKERFYVYRNTLIHEFREPGHGFEHYEDENPFYISVDDDWELVYPLFFIKNIVINVLNSLPAYFKQNNINPYDNYTFGSPWGRQ